MAIIGYMPLHYGKEYLQWALKSMDIADVIHIFYTEKPSYGHGTALPCPETEAELKDIALQFAKVKWHNVQNKHREGDHRNMVLEYCTDDDFMITLDSDEVMHPGHWEAALSEVGRQTFSSYGINGFVNFWKSFNHVVKDGFQPVRIARPKYRRYMSQGTVNATIYHFGYAQREEVMSYKLAIHGHLGDIRNVHGTPDNYFNKWKRWTHPGCGVDYLHPASRDIWVDAEPFDKTTLPDILKDHPYYEL